MSLTVWFTDEAKADALQAVTWYDEQKDKLGSVFIQQLSGTIETIQTQPTAFKKIYQNCRQATIKKFPYIVIYKILDKSIIVYAIFHTSLNPTKKAKRLKK